MGKEGILNEGEGRGDHRETLMFWINQVYKISYSPINSYISLFFFFFFL